MEQPQPSPSRVSQLLLLIRVVIVLSVLAVFGRLGGAEFSWYDDSETLHQNPAMNPPTIAKIAGYWTAIGSRAPQQIYIPLTYTVWGALAKLTYLDQADDYGIHLNPWAFHSFNIALHALAALVVFEILRILLEQDWPAAAGAMLFALHPVQVEPVAWVSGMKDLLYGLLSLIAIWQYLRHVARPEHSRAVSGHYTIATIAFLAAMFAKPTAVVTPLIVFILCRFLRRPSRWDLMLWFALMIPCLIWTRLSQPAPGVESAPIWARPLIALDSLSFYLCKLVLPIHQAVDYGRKPMDVIHNGWIWFTWILPVAIAAILLLPVIRRRHSPLLAGAAIFVAGVLPVLGFVPFSFQNHSGVADHYLYLSMLGPALAFAYLLSAVRAPLPAIVLIPLALLSIRQAGFWHDDALLFAQTLERNPKSLMGWNNHGGALFRQKDLHGAERDFSMAVELAPRDSLSHENMGLALIALGDYPHAENELRLAIELDPTSDSARQKLEALEKMKPR